QFARGAGVSRKRSGDAADLGDGCHRETRRVRGIRGACASRVQLGAAEDARDKPLFLTGHSMGGALAVLTACRLAKMGRPPVAIYTFGAPRVGDRNFCAGYSLPTYRIINGLDLVPEMPLASMKRLLPATPRFTNDKILGKLKAMARRVPCYGHVKT